MSFTFKKEERLCSKKRINELFAINNSFFLYTYKFVWSTANSNKNYPMQIAISVSKKRYKKAVDRNLIKRRIREVYRLNKHISYKSLNERNTQISAMLIYVGKEIYES